MENFITEIEKGLDAGLYQLSLTMSLCLPDICGALESENGYSTSEKYKNWYNKYMKINYPDILTADDCYYFRCSILHQGTTEHKRSKYHKIIFAEPGPIYLHNNVLNNVLNIDIITFCNDVTNGCKAWLEDMSNNTNFVENNKKILKRYENGLPPYIVGIPVYG